jgi:hypothetical protein
MRRESICRLLLAGFEPLEVRMPKDLALHLSTISASLGECVGELSGELRDQPIHMLDGREELRFVSRFVEARLVANVAPDADSLRRVEQRDDRCMALEKMIIAVR